MDDFERKNSDEHVHQLIYFQCDRDEGLLVKCCNLQTALSKERRVGVNRVLSLIRSDQERLLNETEK